MRFGLFEFSIKFYLWQLLTLRIWYPYIQFTYKLYGSSASSLWSKFFDWTNTFWAMPLYNFRKIYVLTSKTTSDPNFISASFSGLVVTTLDSHPGGPGSNPGDPAFVFFIKIGQKISKYLKSKKLLYQTNKYSIIFLWFQKMQWNIVLYFSDFKKKQWNIVLYFSGFKKM